MLAKLSNMVKSRRFWVAVAGVAAVAAETLGLGLSPEMVQNFVIIGASWIVGESLRSSEASSEQQGDNMPLFKRKKESDDNLDESKEDRATERQLKKDEKTADKEEKVELIQ